MPADPNARRDSLLSSILGELKKTNKLLETQNKVIEKMERHARPSVVTQHHPYLERRDGGSDAPSTEGAEHIGPYGTGDNQPYS
jgi:hypothetical protein